MAKPPTHTSSGTSANTAETPEPAGALNSSHSIEDQVTLSIREMLLQGEFQGGQKLVEAAIAERLGVSRMPVRRALAVLERDGLVTIAPNRGAFAARFTLRQVLDARELRGTLEGMAARLIAERGLPPGLKKSLQAMLEEGDDLFAQKNFSPSTAEFYRQMNSRFHTALIEAAESKPLLMAYEANNRLPMASPMAVSVDASNLEEMGKKLRETHNDHHKIVDALKAGQGTRAEALMRDHAHTAIHSFLSYAERLDQLDAKTLPGLRLVIG